MGKHHHSGMSTWRAGCTGTCTSGSEGGPQKPTSRKADRALRSDPYTYVWVGARFWYLATVIDAATKEVIGWRFADHMEASLVADALRAAVARRGTDVRGVVFHTDRGSQYTSAEFGAVCASFGVRQSMGRTGICFDNAAAESFFATFKRELIHRYNWDTAADLHQHMFVWIESWYNRRRRHTSIGMKTPRQAYLDHLNDRAA